MQLPFDNTYAELPAAFAASATPTPVAAPQLIALNRELAELLGLDPDVLGEHAAAWFSGNDVPAGATPIAMAYSGHQFGGFSPVLGDGRAILLGEIVGRDGVRRDVQLKGSGPTPFSLRGDGRSALGPVLREYLVSEAMHALGVPTTRALAAVATGDVVYRETQQPGGVLTRVARSHIRVGTFQYFRARGDLENLRRLLDYTIARLDPDAAHADSPALALFEGVIARQADLVATWMSLGFIHGVMNTDNTNISGETIDYGPCAFMDHFDPAKKFSSIDEGGRYAYNNQPTIGQWNLARLADTLLPFFDEDEARAIEIAQSALSRYPEQFQSAAAIRFCAKIGLPAADQESWDLVQSLLGLMGTHRVDFTRGFRRLASGLEDETPGVLEEFEDADAARSWLVRWRAHLHQNGIDTATAAKRMRAVNPALVPRNHRVEEAIAAGNEGDFAPFHRLHEALKHPYVEDERYAEYRAAPRPDQEVRATFCGT